MAAQDSIFLIGDSKATRTRKARRKNNKRRTEAWQVLDNRGDSPQRWLAFVFECPPPLFFPVFTSGNRPPLGVSKRQSFTKTEAEP